MTNEQINTAIAEACGWHSITTTGIHGMKGPLRGYMQIPDYCNDLNAMHEAEKVLINYGAWETYRNKLTCMFGIDAFAADARERAEVLLKTLGKWEEVQR